MNETLDRDDLMILSAAMTGVLEPVAPPPSVKAALMTAIRGIPQDSTILRAHEGRWTKVADGVRTKTLSFDRDRNAFTLLMVLEPGSVLPEHSHHGPEQTFVVSGSCRIGALSLRAGDFHTAGAGSHHGTVVSDEGCELLLVVDKDDCLAA
ncbi:MAG TPA: cupin domain-containing protein [Thermoanaerobaculia bacterium]|nr:cupin domain-containing protein [Thermoanaerobaculia bacterium]